MKRKVLFNKERQWLKFPFSEQLQAMHRRFALYLLWLVPTNYLPTVNINILKVQWCEWNTCRVYAHRWELTVLDWSGVSESFYLSGFRLIENKWRFDCRLLLKVHKFHPKEYIQLHWIFIDITLTNSCSIFNLVIIIIIIN